MLRPEARLSQGHAGKRVTGKANPLLAAQPPSLPLGIRLPADPARPRRLRAPRDTETSSEAAAGRRDAERCPRFVPQLLPDQGVCCLLCVLAWQVRGGETSFLLKSRTRILLRAKPIPSHGSPVLRTSPGNSLPAPGREGKLRSRNAAKPSRSDSRPSLPPLPFAPFGGTLAAACSGSSLSQGVPRRSPAARRSPRKGTRHLASAF